MRDIIFYLCILKIFLATQWFDLFSWECLPKSKSSIFNEIPFVSVSFYGLGFSCSS